MEGYAVDTFETATDWENVTELMTAMESSVSNALKDEGIKPHVYTHLSHMYAQGCSIYTTYVYPNANTYAETLTRWKKIKASASETLVSHRATISHQHGVGKDHAPYLQSEKGVLGMGAIKSLLTFFDPKQKLNPGTLIDDDLN